MRIYSSGDNYITLIALKRQPRHLEVGEGGKIEKARGKGIQELGIGTKRKEGNKEGRGTPSALKDSILSFLFFPEFYTELVISSR